jgi:glutamine synthetase
MRVESRVPGADINPYIAIAATIAAGLHGIEHRLDPPPPFTGNGYTATNVPRVPATLVDAIAAFEHSGPARKAYGEDVHAHLLNTARQEWITSNSVVTDWELRRNFERI